MERRVPKPKLKITEIISKNSFYIIKQHKLKIHLRKKVMSILRRLSKYSIPRQQKNRNHHNLIHDLDNNKQSSKSCASEYQAQNITFPLTHYRSLFLTKIRNSVPHLVFCITITVSKVCLISQWDNMKWWRMNFCPGNKTRPNVEQSVRLSEQGAARQPTGGLSLGLVGFELVSTFWRIACFLKKNQHIPLHT